MTLGRPPEGHWRCIRCGRENAPGANFCSNCGARVGTERQGGGHAWSAFMGGFYGCFGAVAALTVLIILLVILVIVL